MWGVVKAISRGSFVVEGGVCFRNRVLGWDWGVSVHFRLCPVGVLYFVARSGAVKSCSCAASSVACVLIMSSMFWDWGSVLVLYLSVIVFVLALSCCAQCS